MDSTLQGARRRGPSTPIRRRSWRGAGASHRGYWGWRILRQPPDRHNRRNEHVVSDPRQICGANRPAARYRARPLSLIHSVAAFNCLYLSCVPVTEGERHVPSAEPAASKPHLKIKHFSVFILKHHLSAFYVDLNIWTVNCVKLSLDN